jgi:trimeric autotransporter adhesin
MATIRGTAGRNTLRGANGRDSIFGLKGIDTLLGLGGDDLLDGGVGADTLDGGRGRNTLRGGKGNDTYIVGSASDRVREQGGQGTDTVRASINYTLGNNLENLTLTGSGNFSGSGNALDNIIIGNVGNNVLDGGAGNDTVSGGEGNDTVSGGVGNDTLNGDLGNDTLNGGEGDDTAIGGEGNDTVSGGSGNDTLNGGEGDDTAVGGSGNDSIVGGNGNDNLQGLDGNDLLQGDAGNDILDGGIGVDTMFGGVGDDVYVVDDGADGIGENAGEGNDSVFASASYGLSDNLENLILTGTASINGTGNGLDNVITGNDGNNVLDGSAGNDNLNGGLGSDTLVGGVGNDTLLGADGNDNLSGNDGDDTLLGGDGNDNLSGNDGNDSIDGGIGADAMNGGTGNDTYIVDNAGDSVSEVGGGGVDTVISSFSTVLAADIENLTLTGAGNLNGTGNNSTNVIVGTSGNNNLIGGLGDDYLDGGAGSDNLTGGVGNDTYVVDTLGDRIQEIFGEGSDTVLSNITYTLGDNLENLTLLGTGNLNGTGNSASNILTGNSGNNTLSGLAGNDTLSGGAGNDYLDGGADADTLVGGVGNDTYAITDSNDTISEDVGGGNDVVLAATSYTLGANVETLILLSNTGNTTGVGNELSNTINGNEGDNVLGGGDGSDTLNGGSGNDSLDGGTGVDALAGGLGDDTYTVDDGGDIASENAGEGTDTVFSGASFFSLGANVETLVLLGNGNLTGTGNTGDNTITGNIGSNILDGGEGSDRIQGDAGNDNLSGGVGNDILDGGVGSDTMRGGLGNDTYVVDSTTDSTTDEVNGGFDTVLSGVDFTLSGSSNIENLVLTGFASINGGGNALDNSITGNDGNNTLSGLAGNDILDGGLSTDTLIGGTGDDLYVISDPTDIVVEVLNEGNDTVRANSTYTLGANLETLILVSGAGSINGFGNSASNTITGNEGNNLLDGLVGADQLSGGIGDDTYIVDNSSDAVVEAAGAGTDTVQSTVNYTLGDNTEILILTPGAVNISGTGNAFDNTIIGNESNSTLSGAAGNDTLTDGLGNDTLDGGVGVDIMTGGAGNDTYVVDVLGDIVNESNATEGTADTVRSGINYTLGANLENLELTGSAAIGVGNILGNTITGNTLGNTLDGGAGIDTLIGGGGDDIYVSVNAGEDTLIEAANAGTDIVNSLTSYSLGANLENLNLIGVGDLVGSGNTLENTITGNEGNNTLDGFGGADRLIGGLGSDTYVVDNLGDAVVEDTSGGIADTVQSSIAYTLGANLENLRLTGSDNIDGGGNAVNNTIIGNDGNNSLDGSAGNDSLIGALGNDTYVVDSTGDVVSETVALGGGNDQVRSFVNYTLGENVENLELLGALSVNGTGNALNNTILGNSNDNVLDGLGGADTLSGGAGNDIYFVDAGDRVSEGVGQGNDLVLSTVSFSLGDNLESLTLQPGAGDINGQGNSSNNTITGNEGNNLLEGGAGVDILTGGAGNDTYTIDTAGDLAIETLTLAQNGGIDRVESSVTYTLGANLDNLVLTGASDINGTGNDLNNAITGNDLNNVLDGGAGDDALVGNKGNDFYLVNSLGDTVTEDVGGGSDIVQSSVAFTLGNNVESLILIGTSNIDGLGNDLANTLTGNSGNNSLIGLAGNDTLTGNEGNDYLDGGTGIDNMTGGLGSDTYVVDDFGDIVTDEGVGIDTVISGVSFTLVDNLENLTLTGSAVVGIGNASSNIIIGDNIDNTLFGLEGNDTLSGNDGNDYIDGGGGDDAMSGGVGSDIFVVNTLGDTVTDTGTDVDRVISFVTFTLGSTLENLDLIGEAAIDGIGNALVNTINGNNSSNTLDGGTGADSLNGNGGNDTYFVDDLGDSIVEADAAVATGGVDRVVSTVNFTLGNNLENLELRGAALFGVGNNLDNTLIGNDNDNTLNGSGGVDAMSGGLGNDIYVVDSLLDTVTDAGVGTDSVISSVSFTLGDNLENLTLTGAAAEGLGNALNNTITGNNNPNLLNGGAGADALSGGLGSDTYVIDNSGDTIAETGSDVDQVISFVSYTLATGLENLDLSLGTAAIGIGNESKNTIVGNDSGNFLDGGAEADSLNGGAGNDTYVVDNLNDTIADTTGIDQVLSSVSFTLGTGLDNLELRGTAAIGFGNEQNNIITGNDSSNFLDGKQGADSFSGGLGDDTYIVDDAGDTVADVGIGTDLVQSFVTFTLGANLENLELLGSNTIDGIGNSLDNSITGNIGSNNLAGGLGNDRLDGGGGIDTMSGGLGNDTYFVNESADRAIEGAGEGNDSVFSSATFSLGANVESLTLTGAADINGTGNADANTIVGNAGNNILNGLGGVDDLRGGAGNDIYFVDTVSDVVIENALEGADTVNSSVSYTLGANLETLILATGTLGLSGTGNSLDNTIIGNEGINTIDGGVGIDRLTGGGGDDTYFVDDSNDLVEDTSGLDWVFATTSFNLSTQGQDAEFLVLRGSAISGTGNSLNNYIEGNAANNVLGGGDGDDILNGLANADEMRGGAGDDIYYVENAGDRAIENVNEGYDQVLSTVSFTLGSGVEMLTLQPSAGDLVGVGNNLDNSIVGNEGNNVLDGSTGNDNLAGGLGNDTYLIDSVGDVLFEGATGGVDAVFSAISYSLGDFVENLTLTLGDTAGTGNIRANTITGSSGRNTLNGGAGADLLIGGTGNDTYVVDDSGDVVDESGGLSSDVELVQSSITYTLGAGLENLTLAAGNTNIDGTGNSANNTITGNGGNNTLDGQGGVDRLEGGAGNDVYIVDASDEVVVEVDNGGFDTVRASSNFSLSAFVENLELSGGASTGAGNGLANTITGSVSNNTLIGGGGADFLQGGAGDDAYEIDATDIVVEAISGGIDEIRADFTVTLNNVIYANIENLTLLGTIPINGSGNGSNNSIRGNSGNNILEGLDGNDFLDGRAGDDTLNGGNGNDTLLGDDGNNTLNGGAGADILTGGIGSDNFVFDSSLVAGVVDAISGFTSISDKIVLDASVFTDLGNSAGGTLTDNSPQFRAVATDADVAASSSLVEYSIATGNLFYNNQLFATIAGSSVSATDVFVQP